MKKYLMTGIAALALCVGFTSCSHDLESLSQEEIDLLKAQQVTEKYNQAFIATFGEPAKDQNWGFGPSAGARTRAIIPEDNNYTLTNQTANNPEAPSKPSFRSTTAPQFSATVPDGTPEATSETNLDNNQTYQIKTGSLKGPDERMNMTFYVVDNVTWNAKINANGNGTTFIVTAGKTLTFNQAEANNLRIYMAPGSHLVIGDGVTFKDQNSGAKLYIGNNCTVTCNGTVTFGADYTVLNDGGTFTANVLNIREGTLFYNNGTLNANTDENLKITVKDSYGSHYAELVNSSSLTASSIDVLAGAGMYNVSGGVVNVQGKTYLYNTNSYWWNDGYYTSEDFELNSIDHVWNTCKLTVHKSDNTGTFKIAAGEGGSHTAFVLDANASVQTDKMYFGNNADFYMKNNSMLEVLGDCKAYNFNKNHGIIGLGTGTEYSIFKAGTVTYSEKGQNRMNYYGNLWVDVEVGNHFPQELLDKSNLNEASDQPTYYFKTGEDRTVLFKFFGDPCPITSNIQPGDCHHGYIVNPPTPFEADLRIMAEDLSATEKSDFDFNDIVFDVQFSRAATETTAGNPARIRVRAAGGTLPLRIRIGGTAADRSDWVWQEVHALWNKSTGIMINTNATQRVSESKGHEDPEGFLLDPIDLDYEVGGAEAAQNIVIEVLKSGNWIEMEALKGKPAAKFACSPDHHWAEERQSLSGSYTNFDAWVQGKIGDWEWTDFSY